MADILPHSIPDIDELRARWGGFAFTAENEAQAKVIIGRYPPGRQQSAIIPLLDVAQRLPQPDCRLQVVEVLKHVGLNFRDDGNGVAVSPDLPGERERLPIHA